MAIKPLNKGISGDLLAGGRATANVNQFRVAALLPIDSSGNIIKNTNGFFALNPASWSENKNVNWNEKNVPGNSDPVLQFTSSGPRTVTFEALVTNDTVNSLDITAVQKQQQQTQNTFLNKTANIASKFFSVAVVNNSQITDNSSPQQAQDVLGITNKLNYYRSLAYPTYDQNKRLQQSPPLLVLFDGNAITKAIVSDTITENDDLWVLKDLSINITKQLPSLMPMEATVNFTLIQYNIRSFSSDRFSG